MNMRAVNCERMAESASDCEHGPPIPQSIQDKIRYAFDYADVVNYFKGLIQFWARVKTGGGLILTTSDQPFVLANLDKGIHEYRSCCVKYKYNIDVNKAEVEEDPSIISIGAPAAAFLNQLPLFVGDLMDHQMASLVSSALECGSFHSIVLPVFCPSLSCCVGVIECCSSLFDDLHLVFNILTIALEKVGLKTFHARDRLPYKTICGLQNVKDEIDEALKIIWHAHCLPFSQVWIPYEDENQMAFSSSLQDTQTKRMLWLKLTGHNCDNFNDEDFECLEEYSDACYRIPLRMDKDFAGKTLENYEPHFIKNILKLNDNKPLRLLLSIDFPCSCFVICLKSTKTGDLDYFFEFLWSHKRRHNVILFESLLLTLKRCLSSFKIASGSELDDELHILDVQNSSKSENKYFKIFQTNKLSHESLTPKRGRRPEDEECLTPLKTKCKTTGIILSQEQIKSQSGQTEDEATATFVAIEKEIGDGFQLNPSDKSSSTSKKMEIGFNNL